MVQLFKMLLQIHMGIRVQVRPFPNFFHSYFLYVAVLSDSKKFNKLPSVILKMMLCWDYCTTVIRLLYILIAVKRLHLYSLRC